MTLEDHPVEHRQAARRPVPVKLLERAHHCTSAPSPGRQVSPPRHARRRQSPTPHRQDGVNPDEFGTLTFILCGRCRGPTRTGLIRERHRICWLRCRGSRATAGGSLSIKDEAMGQSSNRRPLSSTQATGTPVPPPARAVRPSPSSRHAHQPPPTTSGLWRAIIFTEVAGLALLNLYWWLSYRSQDLRWRAQGVISMWANDVPRRGQRRARGR